MGYLRVANFMALPPWLLISCAESLLRPLSSTLLTLSARTFEKSVGFTPIALGSVRVRISLFESGLEGAREIRRRKDAAVNLLWSVDTRSWIATPLCESRNQSLGPSYRYSSKGLQDPRRVQKAAGVPDPGFSNQGGKNCSGESHYVCALPCCLCFVPALRNRRRSVRNAQSSSLLPNACRLPLPIRSTRPATSRPPSAQRR